jgi:hypothetical protein
MSNEYIEELESAIIDLLDGNFEKDIQSFTGCSEERSIELRQLFNDVMKNYTRRHTL